MKHLVALSGGKDSTAMALRLAEVEPRDYIFFCTPTGDELPEMKAHYEKLEGLLGQPIIRFTPFGDIYSLIREQNMLPNYLRRFCTVTLKIKAATEFYRKFREATIYVGLRADEPERKGNIGLSVELKQKYPLREWDWGLSEVLTYLNVRGVSIPRRTDCAMCFFQRIGEWWMLWDEYPEIFDKIARLEDEIGHTLMTPGKHKKWPHKLFDLKLEFEAGRKPREIEKGLDARQCRACSL